MLFKQKRKKDRITKPNKFIFVNEMQVTVYFRTHILKPSKSRINWTATFLSIRAKFTEIGLEIVKKNEHMFSISCFVLLQTRVSGRFPL